MSSPKVRGQKRRLTNKGAPGTAKAQTHRPRTKQVALPTAPDRGAFPTKSVATDAPEAAVEVMKSWSTCGGPVTAKHLLRTLEAFQREQGLHRRNPAEFLRPAVETAEPSPAELTARFFDHVAGVLARFWKRGGPVLRQTTQSLLDRAARGEHLTALQLRCAIDAALGKEADAFWATLTEEEVAEYERLMAGAEHRSMTPHEHFREGLLTGTRHYFDMAENLENIVEEHLRSPTCWIPPECRDHPARLFEQPFVSQAFNFIQGMGTFRVTENTVVKAVLRLHFRRFAVPKEQMRLALVREGDSLSLGLSDLGKADAPLIEKYVAERRETSRASGRPRFGCPALRVKPTPLEGSNPGGLRVNEEQHVLQAFRDASLQLVRAHFFPAVADRLKDLHAQTVARLPRE